MNYTVTEVEGGFRIRVEIQINRKRYRKQETFSGSKREAERRARFIILELEEKADEEQETSSRSFQNFKECLDFYRNSGGKLVNSNKSYFNRLEKFLGNKELTKLSYAFGVFLTDLRKSTTRYGKPYSQQSINHYIVTAKSVCSYAFDKKLIDENPLIGYKPVKVPPREVSFNWKDAQRLIKATEEKHPFLLPLVKYCLLVPCRKGELVKARREDYDPVRNVIRLRASTTKSKKAVEKPVPKEMVSYFQSIPEDCPFLFYREGKKGLFKPLGDFKRSWNTIRKAAGLPNFTLHMTRHFAASNLHRAGLSEREVMEISGWTTPMLSTYWDDGGLGTIRRAEEVLADFEQSLKPQLKLCVG